MISTTYQDQLNLHFKQSNKLFAYEQQNRTKSFPFLLQAKNLGQSFNDRQIQQTPSTCFGGYSPGSKFVQSKQQSLQFSDLNEEIEQNKSANNCQLLQVLCVNCQNYINSDSVDSHSNYCLQTDINKTPSQILQPQNSEQILCVNCQNYIDMEAIEKHSNSCTKVQQSIYLLEKKNDQETYVQLKLQKLCQSIQYAIQQKLSNFRIPMFLRTILTVCDASLKLTKHADMQKEILNLGKIKQKIEQDKIIGQQERIFISIYLERLKNLAIEKEQLLRQKLKNQNSSFEGISSEENFSFVQENEQIVQINSTIKKSETSDLNFTADMTEDFSQVHIKEKINQQQQFIRMFFKIKLSFGIDHPCQNIQAKEMFTLALFSGVQEHDWTNYILNYFKDPDQYFSDFFVFSTSEFIREKGMLDISCKGNLSPSIQSSRYSEGNNLQQPLSSFPKMKKVERQRSRFSMQNNH